MDDQNGEEPLQPLYDNFTLEQLLRGINSSNIDFGNNLNFSQGNDTYAHGIFQSEGHPKDDDPMNFWWQNLIHPNPTGNDFRQSHSGHTSPSFSSGEASPTFFNHSQQYPLYNNIGGNLVLNHSDLNSDFSQNPDCFHGGLTYDKLSTLSNNDFKNELPKCQQNPAQNWTNGMPEYHPFQSSTVLQDVEKDVSIDAKPKRSYSDVAKKQPHVSDTASISRSHFKEKRSSSLPEESKTTPPPVYKIRKKNIKSNSVLKKHKRFDTLASNVEPDAKYGLDTFDDNLINPSSDDTFINGGLDDIDDVPASFGSQSKKMTSSGKKCSVDDLSADYSSAKTKKPSTKERPFFDPKRIFQPKTNNTANLATKPKHNKKSSIDCQTGDIIDDCSFILNNGKCCPNITGSPPAATKTTTYINNDLRDRFEPRKQTNTDTKQNRSQPSMDTRASKNLKGSKDMHATEQLDSSTRAQRKMFRKQSQKFQLLGQVCNVMRRWFHWFFIEVLLALIVLAIMVSYKLVVITVFKLCHCISFALAKTVQFVKKHLQSWFTSTSSEKSWSAKDSGYPMFGLDENIVLPTTGEEAMKRLLAGRGKDPYSILGLKSNCSDEDIRRYYRKQAVLVHPDKNPQPGAEEAFKILGHAFELIGKPEKRALYDQQFCENKAAEEAMKEFTDLLAKLREKVQEAAYLMRCDRCGGKHRRLPIERPWYSARQCDRCNTRHSAKEGDLWAESTFLGFLWHYYAWMDGKMYDITEWASCQRENFKHMQANAHYVMYRIATNSNRQNQHTHGRSGENDLEDFINHLIHRTMQSDSDHSSYAAPGSQSSRPAWTPGPATSATKGKKRRKRKH